MLNIKEMLLTSTVTRPKKLISPRAVVIHWTANTAKGANAEANRNYFNTTDRAASAHYIVDDHEIVQCIPENEMAYHVGAKTYKQEAVQRLGKYPNNCTIGIEICVNEDGDWDKTYQRTVELVVDILLRHGLFTNNLWRHYDITGKDCPKPLLDPDKWKQFLVDVQNAYEKRVKGGPEMKSEDALKVANILGAVYNLAGTIRTEQIVIAQEEIHRLANEVRKAGGLPTT